MRRKNLVLTTILFIISIVTSCSNSKPIKTDTPNNTLSLLTSAINFNNYDSFNVLFSDRRKDTVSEEMFSEFSKMNSVGVDQRLYGLIKDSKGEMLLVRLSTIKGEYKVEEIIKIPEKMKKLFQ